MNKSRPLTTSNIAQFNLLGKIWVSAALVTIVAIISFALFGGAILSKSLSNGIKSFEARLGADIAVVPKNQTSAYRNVIISGEPTKFFLSDYIQQEVEQIEGVENATPQLYLSTLSDSCCSEPLQLIGIDFESDFATKAWISKSYNRKINDGELIIGSNIIEDSDNTLTFFNKKMPVAARLAKTATGMDNSIYASIATIRELAKEATKLGYDLSGSNIDNSISSVMVKVKPGYDVDIVCENIMNNLQNVDVVKSNDMIETISRNMNFFSRIIAITTVALGILAAIILAIMFSININTRKKEFAVLRILGATRKKLMSIVMAESLIISVLGAIAGAIIAAISILPFSSYIGAKMGLPFLLPSFLELAILLVISTIISIAIGPISAIYSALKISRAETYATMREGE